MTTNGHLSVLPDVLAMLDVLDVLGETSDSMTVEEAVQLRESMIELRKRAGVVLGLADTQLIAVLESPREFDGQLYEIKSDGKWRPDHNKVKAAVKRAAAVDENGELRRPVDVAEETMRLMSDLYVAPATFPKQGALERLGLDKPDVGHYEATGKRVSVTEVKQA